VFFEGRHVIEFYRLREADQKRVEFLDSVPIDVDGLFHLIERPCCPDVEYVIFQDFYGDGDLPYFLASWVNNVDEIPALYKFQLYVYCVVEIAPIPFVERIEMGRGFDDISPEMINEVIEAFEEIPGYVKRQIEAYLSFE